MSDLFPEIETEPMRYILHEEISKINDTTIRLLRCRDETKPKSKGDEEEVVKIGRSKNELVASYWDDKRTKWRDFIRMTVADTLPEAMPQFLDLSVKEITRLLPKFEGTDKVAGFDCTTVYNFEGFAETLQRR